MMQDFYQLDELKQAQRLQSLADHALVFWGLEEADLRLIKYRENAVFEVKPQDKRRYALRIHRPGYHSDRALKSELLWLEALAQSDILVPKLIKNLADESFKLVKVDAIPEARQVDILAWVEGEQIGSIEAGLGEDIEQINCLFTCLGEMAAKLHNQSSQWRLPERFERHAWDLEGLLGEQPFWGRYWELSLLSPAQKDLLITLREVLYNDLSNVAKTPQNYSLIHADFVPENVLNDKGEMRLIDFDDAGFGWHMFELATALYFIREDNIYPHAKTALLAGYRQYRSLSEQDEAQLELFITVRAMTYLGWIRSRQETQTAREMAPELIRLACLQAQRYLKQR